MKIELGSQAGSLAYRFSEGSKPALVCFHGFGSTKEDYAGLEGHPPLKGHAILSFDAPGCGASVCADPARLSVFAIVEAAEALLERFRIARAHVIGHSMGGLAALLFAAKHSARSLSLTSIEGNLTYADDCFYSRQALEGVFATPEDFFGRLLAQIMEGRHPGEALYGAGLSAKIGAEAALAYLRSVALETRDRKPLDIFLELPVRKHFVYGAANRTLSYLSTLKANGVKVTEIPEAGHFPMLTNPPVLWRAISDFIAN